MVDTSVRLPEAPSQRDDDLYRICECFRSIKGQAPREASYQCYWRLPWNEIVCFWSVATEEAALWESALVCKCGHISYLYLKTESRSGLPEWAEITIVWCGTEILHSWGDHSDHSFRVQRRVRLQADYFHNRGWRPLRWLYTLCCIKLIGKKSHFRLSLEGKSGARPEGKYTVAAGMSHKP